VIGALMLTVGVLLTVGFALLPGPLRWVALPTTAFCAFACRVLMLGVQVNDWGVRVRRVAGTDTFAWSSVLAVRQMKIVLGTIDNSGDLLDARQVCFDLADGRTIDTPIHGQRRDGSRSWRTPAVLPIDRFERVLAELRHAAATVAVPRTVGSDDG
jgi:hypothetical protein